MKQPGTRLKRSKTECLCACYSDDRQNATRPQLPMIDTTAEISLCWLGVTGKTLGTRFQDLEYTIRRREVIPQRLMLTIDFISLRQVSLHSVSAKSFEKCMVRDFLGFSCFNQSPYTSLSDLLSAKRKHWIQIELISVTLQPSSCTDNKLPQSIVQQYQRGLQHSRM